MPEFTEELNEEVLADIRRRIQESTRRREIGTSGRASKRGLAGSTFEGAQLSRVGKAGQEAELSAALQFAFENATRQREERLIREERQAREAETGRGREFSREERVGGQEFVSGESRLGREAAIAEAARGREFSSTEAELLRRFTGEEAQLGREFQTGEREASTDAQRRRDELLNRFRQQGLSSEQAFARLESAEGRRQELEVQERARIGSSGQLAQLQGGTAREGALEREAAEQRTRLQGQAGIEQARIGQTGATQRSNEQLRIEANQREKDRRLRREQTESELFGGLFGGLGSIIGGLS